MKVSLVAPTLNLKLTNNKCITTYIASISTPFVRMDSIVQESVPRELCSRREIIQNVTAEAVRITIKCSGRSVESVQLLRGIEHGEVIGAKIGPYYATRDTVLDTPQSSGSIEVDPDIVPDAVDVNLKVKCGSSSVIAKYKNSPHFLPQKCHDTHWGCFVHWEYA